MERPGGAMPGECAAPACSSCRGGAAPPAPAADAAAAMGEMAGGTSSLYRNRKCISTASILSQMM